jgi:orotate phosphoribosyltransferase
LTPPRPQANLPLMPDHDRAAERARLLEILVQRSLRFGRFRLASGGESEFYVDVRKTSLDPEGAALAARLFVDLCNLGGPGGPTAVGGPTLGADPLVTAMGLECLARGRRVECFLVRKETKDHGTGNRIEGNLSAGARVLLVDDVITQGGSLLSAAPAVRSAGAEIAAFGCVVDREAGGSEKLAAYAVPSHSIFTMAELLRAGGRADLIRS